ASVRESAKDRALGNSHVDKARLSVCFPCHDGARLAFRLCPRTRRWRGSESVLRDHAGDLLSYDEQPIFTSGVAAKLATLRQRCTSERGFSGRSHADDVVGGEKVGRQTPPRVTDAQLLHRRLRRCESRPGGHAETVGRDRRTPKKPRRRTTAVKARRERSAGLPARPRQADCRGGPPVSSRFASAAFDLRGSSKL